MEMFQFDQFYKLQNTRWDKVDAFPQPISKLSLFSRESIVKQHQTLVSLLETFLSPLYVRCVSRAERKVWELFADHKMLLQIINELEATEFDYLLWPLNSHTPPKLMLFDMDSTFIQIEVIDELASRHGVGEKVSAVTEAAMRGELDFSESLISRVACLEGLVQSTIEDIAAQLPLSPGVNELIEATREQNTRVAIVSGGFLPFVEKLKNDLALFQVKANQLAVAEKKLTGKVIGKIVDAQVKADFLHELCGQLGIDSEQAMAIGDGANDLLMMQAAGFNLAYKAKPKVQQQAKGRINQTTLDWLIDVFDWS